MADVDQILETIKGEVLALVTKEAKEYLSEARQDAEVVANALAEDMKDWIIQRANGELSEGDFAVLVRGRRSVVKMSALSDAGLAKVRIDRIVDGVIDIVIAAAGAAI